MGKAIKIIILILILLGAAVLGPSAYVAMSTAGDIAVTYDGTDVSEDAVESLKEIEPQCILVLGCAAWADDQPSPMLQDRLDTAIELYRKGAAPKLLLSGDNSIPEYSEPDCMLKYVLAQGIPEEDVFLDYAGFSTYESVYRARDVFCVDRMIVVTQKYHLFRALNVSRALGVEAKGAAAGQRKYTGRVFREAREVLARDKDLIKGIYKPEPTFLGDKIPISGDGSVTHVNLNTENE